MPSAASYDRPPAGTLAQVRGDGDGGGSWWRCPWRGAEPWLLGRDTCSLPQFPHSPHGSAGCAPQGCLGSGGGKSRMKTGLAAAPKILAEALPPELPLGNLVGFSHFI